MYQGARLHRSLELSIEDWPLTEPFRITGYSFSTIRVLVVTVNEGVHRGSGEAVGVYYHGDTPEGMASVVESIRTQVERGCTRSELRRLLPPGGARNALDCALWALEARAAGRSVLCAEGPDGSVRPILTTWTISADTPARMAAKAFHYAPARALKLKLLGDADDANRVEAVRQARPDAWLSVDGNQGFDPGTLARLMPVLAKADVKLIEQPFPIGADGELRAFTCKIPFAADESVQDSSDIAKLAGLVDVVNIKLDKCGGLTEAFEMVSAIRAHGMQPMVGCMWGTSLAMAPGFLLSQQCDFVDLDGPLSLERDRRHPVSYHDGFLYCTEEAWQT
jgi:L-alanine-DL-glutamate epimerase-like enolase superfamily enzyme